jgi:hypothetical protein
MRRREPFIAGWKTPSDWYEFRTRLLKGSNQELWKKAFDEYFKARLNFRYFNPIKILQDNGTFEGEGFSIMAILCTLVEFLESTIRGIKYKYAKHKKDLAKYEYNVSSEIFINFLSKRAPFSSYFDEEVSFEFYKNVRCGLLHEAHTKGGWTIWAKSPDGAIINKDKKIVYRDDFKSAFDEYVEGYGKKLLTDTELQGAFIRKFDFICEET